MFYLSRIEHTLRLPPDLLSLPLEQAIRQELNKLFLDKVVPNLGLCVSVGAIKSIEGGFIHAGDGASTYTADFMLVMFRPFVGEVISARLKESDADGLRLTLGFFEDIYVPAYFLPNPSRFEPDSRNKKMGIWTWHYNDDDNEIDYPIEGDGEIRFQVNSVKYPSIPIERKAEDTKPFAPMLITGSIDREGLGPLSWWV